MEYHGDLITAFKGSFSNASHTFQRTTAEMVDKYLLQIETTAFSFIFQLI